MRLQSEGPGIAGIQRGLQSAATDLTPEELERHRKLHGLQSAAIGKYEGVAPHNVPYGGPQTRGDLGNPDVFVGPHSGTAFRMVSKGGPQKALGVMALLSPTVPKGLHSAFARPEDQTLQHAVLDHERAERTMMQGMAAGQYNPRPVASHLGGLANIAERHTTYRDPAAVNVVDKFRAQDPGDSFITKKMKQYGATPGRPLPMGGRAHRTLENAIRDQAPSNSMALRNRMGTEAPMSGPMKKQLQQWLDAVGRHVPRITPHLPASMRTRIQNMLPGIQQYLKGYIHQAPGVDYPQHMLASLSSLGRRG